MRRKLGELVLWSFRRSVNDCRSRLGDDKVGIGADKHVERIDGHRGETMKNKPTFLLVSCFLLSGIWLPAKAQVPDVAAYEDYLKKCQQDISDVEIRLNNLRILIDAYITAKDKTIEDRWYAWVRERSELAVKIPEMCYELKLAKMFPSLYTPNKTSPTPSPTPTPEPNTGPPIVPIDPNVPPSKDELKKLKNLWDKIGPLEAEIFDWVKKQKAKLPPAQPIDGLKTSVDWQPGLHIIKFDTPKETITVSLPDDIRAGDSFSGTVYAEPRVKEPGKNETRDPGAPQVELIRTNQNGLTEYFRIPTIKYYVPGRFADGGGASGTVQTYDVGTAPGTFTCTLTIVSPNGKEILLIPLQTSSEPVTKTGASADLKLPTLGQAGRNQSINGTFDGNADSTNVSIAGKPVEVIAESPRKCVFRAPADAVGPSEITVNENGRETKGTYRNVGVKLTAPKTNLLRGEKTTLTVQVTGLSGIRNDVPLQLEKAGTVTMQDGDMQHIQIRPQDVDPNGVFTLTRAITGVKPGGFNVTATVHDPNRRPVVIPLTDGARTNGYRITGSGANSGLEIENVIDPVTGKPLAGQHKLQAGCGQPVLTALPILNFLFKNGNASMKKTECLVFITPRIVVE